MRTERNKKIVNEIERVTGIDFETLLTPIAEDMPSGENLEYSSVYREIQKDRIEDNPNIPLKPGKKEPKVGDWDRVISTVSETIAYKSKDLQLGVWLLEALVRKRKFYGVALGCFILRQLCERYWDSLYPQIEDGDLEYRTNLFGWINSHLLPTLRLVPVTETQRDHREMNWSDWQLSNKLDLTRPVNKGGGAISSLESSQNNVAPKETFLVSVDGSSTEFYKMLYWELSEAVAEINSLDNCLKELCGSQSQYLGKFKGLLEEIYLFAETTLDQRGALKLEPDEEDENDDDIAEMEATSIPESVASFINSDSDEQYIEEAYLDSYEEVNEKILQENRDVPAVETKIQAQRFKRNLKKLTGIKNGHSKKDREAQSDSPMERRELFQNREEAYAMLNRISQYLMRHEPHSPGPHLVKLAAEWGALSTADLFRELFIKRQGQLNIFEVLGIDPSELEEPKE